MTGGDDRFHEVRGVVFAVNESDSGSDNSSVEDTDDRKVVVDDVAAAVFAGFFINLDPPPFVVEFFKDRRCSLGASGASGPVVSSKEWVEEEDEPENLDCFLYNGVLLNLVVRRMVGS